MYVLRVDHEHVMMELHTGRREGNHVWATSAGTR